MEKTYSKEEIEGYLLKKKKEGANEITLHQLQMAFLLRIPMEAIEVMGEVAMKDFEKREWILALAMEGFPQEQLMELVTLSIQEIKDKKVDYFRKQQIKEVQN